MGRAHLIDRTQHSLLSTNQHQAAPASKLINMNTWLDCDPGHDDAMALILAAHSPLINLIGVSTVHGNQSIEKVTLNAAKVLFAAGVTSVPVYSGQSCPLLRTAKHDPDIHGETGLCGTDKLPLAAELPADIIRTDKKGVMAMAEAILALPEGEQMHVVASGALTNVALMLTLYPEVKARISCISFMGGAIGIGNRGPVAEFNIQIDPEAAQMVCNCGCKVVMVPLEVTHTALATAQVLGRISAFDSRFGSMIVELLTFFKDTYKRVFQMDDPPVHDPCAVAYLIHPEIFEVGFMRVDVECGSQLSFGQTVCDVWGDSKLPANVHVCRAMDVPKFWDCMVAALESANQISPVNEAAASPSKRVKR